jgi:hypothetical protein
MPAISTLTREEFLEQLSPLSVSACAAVDSETACDICTSEPVDTPILETEERAVLLHGRHTFGETCARRVSDRGDLPEGDQRRGRPQRGSSGGARACSHSCSCSSYEHMPAHECSQPPSRHVVSRLSSFWRNHFSFFSTLTAASPAYPRRPHRAFSSRSHHICLLFTTSTTAPHAFCICSGFERFHHADSTDSSTSALASQAYVVFDFFFDLVIAFRSAMNDGNCLQAHGF